MQTEKNPSCSDQENKQDSPKTDSQNLIDLKNYLDAGDKCYKEGRFSESFQSYKRILDYFDCQTQVIELDKASVYKKLGLAAFENGDYQNALSFLTQALTLNEDANNEHMSETAVIKLGIGRLYTTQAKFTDALDNLQSALDILNKGSSQLSQKVRACYNCFGEFYDAQANYSEALLYLKKSLDIPLTTTFEDNTELARSYYLLGRTYQSLADYSQALHSISKALNIFQNLHGELNHPDIALCYHVIGSVYMWQGKISEGLENYQISLKIRINFLGESHPSVAESYGNIAIAHRKLGNYIVAFDFYDKCIKIFLSTFGEVHPKVSTAYINYGNLFYSQHQYNQALTYFQKALNTRLQLNQDNLEVALIHNNMGAIYLQKEDYKKAKKHFIEALDIRSKHSSVKHPDTAICYMNLARLYFRKRDFHNALENCINVLKIRYALFGAVHSDIFQYALLRQILEHNKDSGSGRSFLLKKKQIESKLFAKYHPAVQMTKEEIRVAERKKDLQDHGHSLNI